MSLRKKAQRQGSRRAAAHSANNMPPGSRQVSDGEPASCVSLSAAPGLGQEENGPEVGAVNSKTCAADNSEKCAAQEETGGREDPGHQFRHHEKNGSCSQEGEKETEPRILGEVCCPAKTDVFSPETSSGSQEHGLFSGEISEEDEGQDEEDVLAAFVRRMGGARVIRRILIANNGNAAVRVSAAEIDRQPDFRAGKTRVPRKRALLRACVRIRG